MVPNPLARRVIEMGWGQGKFPQALYPTNEMSVELEEAMRASCAVPTTA